VKTLELRKQHLLQSQVFEYLDNIQKEGEFKLTSLKSWGIDLLLGKKDGEKAYFTAPENQRNPGEFYREGDFSFQVESVVSELPQNVKITAKIEQEDGIAYVVTTIEKDTVKQTIMKVPAGSLLLSFLKKQNLPLLMEAIRNLGTISELRKQKGQEGRTISPEDWPANAIKFLKEAKKLSKKAGFGRISLIFFNKDKEGNHRFQLAWHLPTIYLFYQDFAKSVNACLDLI